MLFNSEGRHIVQKEKILKFSNAFKGKYTGFLSLELREIWSSNILNMKFRTACKTCAEWKGTNSKVH